MQPETPKALLMIALAAAAWAGPSWAESVTGNEAQCNPRDQLDCSCKEISYPNRTVRACFEAARSVLTLNQADELAANAFAAISWPGSDVRGLPDFQALTAKTMVPPDHAPVWQGWRSTSDIFRADGAAPLDWDSPQQLIPDACAGVTLTQDLRTAYAWAEVPDSPYPPRVLEQMINPQMEVLVDKSGQPVRYEVAFNWQAWNYVVEHGLWAVQGLQSATWNGSNLAFPAGRLLNKEKQIPETRGAMIVKAAWKILDPALDNPGHFHKAWAFVTPVVEGGDARRGCEIRPVGLVGLHVTMKLHSGWLWGTVEHRALAPLETQLQSMPPAYSASGDEPTGATGGWIFYEPPGCGGALCAGGLGTPTIASGSPELPEFPPLPSRIMQMHAPGSYYPAGSGQPNADCGEDRAYTAGLSASTSRIDFHCINQRLWAGFKGSALEFYQLKGSQWTDSDNTPEPRLLANAAIESFNQDSSSCQACHQTAGRPPGERLDYESLSPSQFDHVFAFIRINGMNTDGTLPKAIPPAGE